MKHYFSFIKDSMTANWDAPAITDFQGTISYTYGQLAQQIARFSIIFDLLGLREGDKIAITGRNSANWGVAYLAAAAHRNVVVSILPDFTEDSIHELVNHSDAKVVFIGPWVRGRINLESMPNVLTFFAIEDLSIIQTNTPINMQEVEQIFEHKYPNGFTAKHLHFPTDNLEDVALINYTSGSTGSPKGVMVTHHNLSSNVLFGQQNIPNNPSKSVVSMLPLAHMFGLMFEFLYQLAGGTHIFFITKSLTPSLLIKAFAEVKPYMILTVPLVIEKIFKKSIFPAIQKPFIHCIWNTPLINISLRKKVRNKLLQTFGGRLEHLIIGGAALNRDVEICLRQMHFPYTCGYGMTECAPLLCYANWQTYVMGSCGRVVDRMELKVDSENPYKEEGEILVRGEAVMRGYYKNLQATDNIFTTDGWMRTGDIGIIDKNGNVFLRGRSKNMILGASGQNIYPEEIEDKLNSMEGVLESIVIERDGKLIGLVFPDQFSLEKLAEIKARMEENLKKLNKLLPSYSKVSDIEVVDKEFEKTPKKSIKRFLYK